MTVVLIICAIFGGISCVCATVGLCVLVGQGKLTLPNTNARRMMQARTDAAVLESKLKQEQIYTMIDAQIELRFKAAQLPSGETR